jgi:exonuclease III
MRLLTINIPRPDSDYCGKRKELENLKPEEWKDRIIAFINKVNPDVIFFIEEWGNVYKLVKHALEQIGFIFYPHDFNMNNWAGIVAAVKSRIPVSQYNNGKEWVSHVGQKGKPDRWLCLDIENNKFLGVHYPIYSPTNSEHDDFHDAILLFAAKERPLVILGDFNSKPSTTTQIPGYKDCLSKIYPAPTNAFGKKVDYIFISSKYGCVKGENIREVWEGDEVFSDHSSTFVEL